MSVAFVLLASRTSSNVLPNVPVHIWPPVLPCHHLECFPVSLVTSSGCSMVKICDSLPHVFVPSDHQSWAIPPASISFCKLISRPPLFQFVSVSSLLLSYLFIKGHV